MKTLFTNQLFLLCLTILLSLEVKAQDPVFSQFYNSAVYLNPALVGEEEDIYLNFAHRSQWRNLEFPYTTHQASLMVPYYKDKHRRPAGHIGGFGVSFYGDMSGEARNLKTYGGNASFAYNLQFSETYTSRLTFALQAGFIQKRIDKNNLRWGEQYNPFIGFDNTIVPSDIDQLDNSLFLDLTAGAFYRYYPASNDKVIRSLYAGFAAAHLNTPDESVLDGISSRLPVLYKFHGGSVFYLSEKASVSANVLSMFQDGLNQTNLGAFLSYMLPYEASGALTNMLTRIGAWHRINDSFIASLEFVTNNFQVGFSYDWNVTSLRYNNRGPGSYEISMGYRFYTPAPPKVRY